MIDSFIKFGWPVLLKDKAAAIIKDSRENIFIPSKRSPNLNETDDGKEFVS